MSGKNDTVITEKHGYHNENGDNDGDTFNPINWGLSQFLSWTKVLEETKSLGGHGGSSHGTDLIRRGDYGNTEWG